MRQFLFLLVLTLILEGISLAQEVRRALPVPSPGAAPAAPSAPSDIAFEAAAEVRRAKPVPSRAEDELGKFLVGIRLPSDSPLAPLQQSGEYGEHSAALARVWRHYNENYFMPMRLWSEITLSTKLRPELPLLYFFGGPDAINAMALFPEASHTLLFGVEPVGNIVSPPDLPREELGLALTALRQSLDVALSYGHFITKDMKTDLDRGAFRGVLPLLLAFLALSGAEILDVTYLTIGKGGMPKEHGNRNTAESGDLQGVRVTFLRTEGAPRQTLTYVQANVADNSLKANPSVLQWAGQFGESNAYLKAASYLMHEANFSRVRTFLLENSEALLQDDSGIPLHNFSKDQWHLEFFGAYTGTLDIFTKYFQGDLLEAFLKQQAAPLPFGTGYKWRKGESNLMLATRLHRPAT